MNMVDPVGHIYRRAGGDEPYFRLVEAFYAGVEKDPVLRPMYPADLTEAKKHLALFLIQRTGGPANYEGLRGHPRLRGRHMPFAIGLIERNAWMHYMTEALAQVPEFAEDRDVLLEFFGEVATFLINQQ